MMALYVNGEQIEHALIGDEIHRLRPSYERAFGDLDEDNRERQLVQWSRENVIEAVIFRQQARKEFSDIEDRVIQQTLDRLLAKENETGPVHQRLAAGAEEEQTLRSEIADQIRHEQLMQKIAGNLPDPSDKAVRKHYERNIERFTMPEMVHAAHIVKHPNAETSPDELKSQIEAIYQRLEAGEPFEKLAGEHSDCPDSAGDLGFFARGKMVPAFEAVVFNLAPGRYSGVFETEFGMHIAKVYEKRPPVPCPLEQVREVIVRDLKNQAREKAVETFLDTHKARSVIEER
jgi:parvulin-like peptidyl-prolyl isomerase